MTNELSLILSEWYQTHIEPFVGGKDSTIICSGTYIFLSMSRDGQIVIFRNTNSNSNTNTNSGFDYTVFSISGCHSISDLILLSYEVISDFRKSNEIKYIVVVALIGPRNERRKELRIHELISSNFMNTNESFISDTYIPYTCEENYTIGLIRPITIINNTIIVSLNEIHGSDIINTIKQSLVLLTFDFEKKQIEVLFKYNLRTAIQITDTDKDKDKDTNIRSMIVTEGNKLNNINIIFVLIDNPLRILVFLLEDTNSIKLLEIQNIDDRIPLEFKNRKYEEEAEIELVVSRYDELIIVSLPIGMGLVIVSWIIKSNSLYTKGIDLDFQGVKILHSDAEIIQIVSLCDTSVATISIKDSSYSMSLINVRNIIRNNNEELVRRLIHIKLNFCLGGELDQKNMKLNRIAVSHSPKGYPIAMYLLLYDDIEHSPCVSHISFDDNELRSELCCEKRDLINSRLNIKNRNRNENIITLLSGITGCEFLFDYNYEINKINKSHKSVSDEQMNEYELQGDRQETAGKLLNEISYKSSSGIKFLYVGISGLLCTKKHDEDAYIILMQNSIPGSLGSRGIKQIYPKLISGRTADVRQIPFLPICGYIGRGLMKGSGVVIGFKYSDSVSLDVTSKGGTNGMSYDAIFYKDEFVYESERPKSLPPLSWIATLRKDECPLSVSIGVDFVCVITLLNVYFISRSSGITRNSYELNGICPSFNCNLIVQLNDDIQLENDQGSCNKRKGDSKNFNQLKSSNLTLISSGNYCIISDSRSMLLLSVSLEGSSVHEIYRENFNHRLLGNRGFDLVQYNEPRFDFYMGCSGEVYRLRQKKCDVQILLPVGFREWRWHLYGVLQNSSYSLVDFTENGVLMLNTENLVANVKKFDELTYNFFRGLVKLCTGTPLSDASFCPLDNSELFQISIDVNGIETKLKVENSDILNVPLSRFYNNTNVNYI